MPYRRIPWSGVPLYFFLSSSTNHSTSYSFHLPGQSLRRQLWMEESKWQKNVMIFRTYMYTCTLYTLHTLQNGKNVNTLNNVIVSYGRLCIHTSKVDRRGGRPVSPTVDQHQLQQIGITCSIWASRAVDQHNRQSISITCDRSASHAVDQHQLQ